MKDLPVVISASRMTDMPAFYPLDIIREVEARKSRGLQIHTIVLWTKHAASILKNPLFSYLEEQKKLGTQIYIQLTITGIGKESFVTGTNNRKVFLEPCVPSPEESISFIEPLINFVEKPQRLLLRIDPLIRLIDANGTVFSNYETALEMVQKLKSVQSFAFSFLEKDVYKKVDNRFTKYGLQILSPDLEERLTFASTLNKLAKKRNVTISACSVPGLQQSACINGHLLAELHNEKWPLDLSQPRSRSLCGCTKSIDIGGWPSKFCNSGCLYCYSRPRFPEF